MPATRPWYDLFLIFFWLKVGLMKSILILGKDGQIGWELQRSLAPLGTITALGRAQGDLSQLGALRSTLEQIQPDIIVNAAAYTDVDKAEDPKRKELVQTINTKAIEAIGHYAYEKKALVVHYSTDYVFDGSQSTPYIESDEAAPLNVYGQSKYDGEVALRHTGCEHFIFRTSWVYSKYGNSFLRTMMQLAQQRDHFTVVNDQLGAPTSATLIADVTALSLWAHQRDELSTGLYHLNASGQTSWHGFARYIVQQMQANGMNTQTQADRIEAIKTADYPNATARPQYSHLDCSKLSQALGIHLPHWQYHVKRAIAELKSADLNR